MPVTIVVDDRAAHLIPSESSIGPCLIGGTVVDPKVMLGELDMLIANDIGIPACSWPPRPT